MIDLDENTVTDATLAQMSTTADPRLKEIMDAAVRHLHAFAREVNLTPAELPLGANIVANHTAPEIVLYGKVTANDGTPLPNALVQVWQTNEHGLYDVQAHDDAHMDMRGNFRTDAKGNYHFRTVRPLGYSIPMDGPVGRLVQRQGRHGMRPSHVHMLITAPGHRELVSALYFADDPNIGSDAVFGVSASLVIDARDNADCPIPGLKSVRYDFRMPVVGDNDTGRVGADPASFKFAAE